MRPIAKWTEADLDALVQDGVQESLTLDYKASPSLDLADNKRRDELAKDVAAFANSAGGVIIYGIEEDKQRPIRVDDGCGAAINRERVEQILNSTIQPRVAGLVIKAIPLNGRGNAFVIEVPASRSAPHQAPDKRYYKRFNFQSVAMHDYEVRDVMRRQTAPELTLDWIVYRSGEVPREGIYEVTVAFDCRNLSSEPAMYTLASIILDKELSPRGPKGFQAVHRTVVHPTQGSHPAIVYSRHFAVPDSPPLFREAPLQLGSATLEMKPDTVYLVGWQLATPGFGAHMIGMAQIGPSGHPRFGFMNAENPAAVLSMPNT